MTRPRYYLLPVLLALTISSCLLTSPTTQRTTSPPEPSPQPTNTSPVPSLADPFETDWDDRSWFKNGLVSNEEGVLDQLPGASVYHIDLAISEDLEHLIGELEVRYTNQEDQPLHEVYLRLYPNLLGGSVEVNAATVDGQEVDTQLESADSAMRLPLGQALSPGDSIVIGISFAVQVPTDPGANYGILLYGEGILSLAHFYPMIAVYDDQGWNVEIPAPNGDVLYADSSFFVVRIDAPSNLVLATSGVAVEREESAGRQQVTYSAGPVRDFFVAASMDYAVVSAKFGDTTVNSYAPSAYKDVAKKVLTHTLDALKVFSERYGIYPFTEFDVAATPTLALGVEFPGITVITQRYYDPDQTTYGPEYIESTVAHEVGHQWFYSVVGNDQVDEPWVDESLTQYITLLYWQDMYGPDAAAGFRNSLYGRWDRVDRAHIPIGMPVAEYSGLEYGAIVYGRGALFFEALAEVLGKEGIAGFMREYYAQHKWGIATGTGLKQLAEKTCSCDLTDLFVEWVY